MTGLNLPVHLLAIKVVYPKATDKIGLDGEQEQLKSIKKLF